MSTIRLHIKLLSFFCLFSVFASTPSAEAQSELYTARFLGRSCGMGVTGPCISSLRIRMSPKNGAILAFEENGFQISRMILMEKGEIQDITSEITSLGITSPFARPLGINAKGELLIRSNVNYIDLVKKPDLHVAMDLDSPTYTRHFVTNRADDAGLNEAGEVFFVDGGLPHDLVRWSAGTTNVLASALYTGSGIWPEITAVNETGSVLGRTGNQAFIYRPGTELARRIGTPAAMNTLNQVLFWFMSPNPCLLWENGNETALPSGFSALGINTAGTVVGTRLIDNQSRGSLLINGEFFDVNALVNLPEWQISTVNEISDNGALLVTATPTGSPTGPYSFFKLNRRR